MSIKTCQICGGLYATEIGELFAGKPCKCPPNAKRTPMPNDTERMEVIAEVAIIQYERTVPAGLYGKERTELKAIILSAITEATAKQSEEIEALRNEVRVKYILVDQQAERIFGLVDENHTLQSELTRIKEGVKGEIIKHLKEVGNHIDISLTTEKETTSLLRLKDFIATKIYNLVGGH